MIVRVNKTECNSDRVPILFYWKTQKLKQAFVGSIVDITAYKPFTVIKGFTAVKVEQGVFRQDAEVAIKFENRDEKSQFLRHIYELGNDCNMYIACPDDIPRRVISDWVNKSLPDMGIKSNTPINFTE